MKNLFRVLKKYLEGFVICVGEKTLKKPLFIRVQVAKSSLSVLQRVCRACVKLLRSCELIYDLKTKLPFPLSIGHNLDNATPSV
jgi:hypothetical protein